MLFGIAAGLFVVGILLYIAGKTMALRKFAKSGGAGDMLDEMFGTAAEAFGDFAKSGSPDDAINNGVGGMGKMAKAGMRAQAKIAKKFWLENLLYIVGKLMMLGGVILAIVATLMLIF